MKRGLAGLLTVALVGLVGWAGFEMVAERAPEWIEQKARAALASSPDWQGTIGTLEVDLRNRSILVEDLDVHAIGDQKVLRSVSVDQAFYRFRWRDVVRGELHLVGTAVGPSVRAGIMAPREPKSHHPRPDAGFFRFSVDTALVDGSWSWLHPDGSHHDVEQLVGVYDHLGTSDGPGHLEVFGRASDTGTVQGEGSLDFFNAHRDAIDLALELRGFDRAAIQGMDRAYLATSIEDGIIDADVAFTLDKGDVNLEPPYRTGQVPDLSEGKLAGRVEARDLRWGGLPIEPVEVNALSMFFAGPLEACDTPWSGGVAARGVKLAMKRSQLAHFKPAGKKQGATPPSEVLAAVPNFVVAHAQVDDLVLEFTDDSRPEPVVLATSPLVATLSDFNNLENGRATRVRLMGEVLEGDLEVEGEMELDVWPPRTDLAGSVSNVDATTLLANLRPYVPAGSAAGRLDAHGSLILDADGEITPQVEFSGSSLDVEVGTWTGRLGRGAVDLFGGRADLTAIRVDNSDDASVFDGGVVEGASVTWDAMRLFDDQEVVAAVTLRGPTLKLRRPEQMGGEGAMVVPSEKFKLDVHATDGTLSWEDPMAASTLTLSPFKADILGLGTMTKRAHWTVSGELQRGGTLSGWADVDAFAGPGADQEIDAFATLEGLDLSSFAAEAKSYAQISDVRGLADLELAINPENMSFSAVGTNLSFSHALVDLDARRGGAAITVVPDEPLTLSGSLEDATVEVRLSKAGGGSDQGSAPPELHVQTLDLIDSTVRLHTADGPLELKDTFLQARDLSWPPRTGHGTMNLAATVLGGEVAADLTPTDSHHLLDVRGRGLRLARTNPWLEPIAGLDLDGGKAAVHGEIELATSGRAEGTIRARVSDLDVFQKSDWDRGFFGAVREAAIGTVLHLADDDDVLELVVPFDSEAEKAVDPTASVLQALKRRFHLSKRDDAGWARFDRALTPEAVSDLAEDAKQ